MAHRQKPQWALVRRRGRGGDVKEEAEKQRAEAIAKAQKETETLKAAVAGVLKTSDGKKLWGYLHKICGQRRSSLVVDFNTAQVRAESTTYNEARRELYLRLSALADPNDLKDVEYLKENQ
jgi:hypothetical protein